ncbi:MAG TPA: thioredoxin domain-containing protein [Verrucomicrobiae bacterium]|nr:thioredoxin domain-containing protein [Verrucomicrobiae bacterium]
MKQITRAEFDSEVLASNAPVLVDFYTDTCPPCRAMAPILQEWETEANGSLKFVKVDAASELDLASAYRVNAVPAFYLFSNGRCVAQTVGLKSKSSIKKWFDDSLRAAA